MSSNEHSPLVSSALELFGNLIKVRRLERGITQKDLARSLNISAQTVRCIETGQGNVKVGTVFEVANHLGINLFELDEVSVHEMNEELRDQLTVLPKKLRQPSKSVCVDF
ncbi:helix-turn-helix transcriptional regulator [Thalassospira lucentensis]|uniref:helix-turn-helix transcriptional regulator n=1 Tax=Thalassospira lucentensis TaxID=168935 RepID=UPI003D2DA1F6|tara:strand:+ start:101444 stop:101773 length:330 start_codon:yes stop_codon:yes gene_type:complete